MLTGIADYDDLEQRPENDDSTQSPSSQSFAAFEQYLQDNLPRRIRETFEAMLNEQYLPLEESLKTALPEAIRTCQAQLFRDWERHSSGDVQDRDGDVSKQSHETKEVIDHETDNVTSKSRKPSQSLPQSAFQDASLSAFYVEPAPTFFESIFESTVQGQFQESGAGRSRTITDSGYASLCPNSGTVHLESLTPLDVTAAANTCTYPADLADPGIADLDFPFGFEFNWSDLPVDHENGQIERPKIE